MDNRSILKQRINGVILCLIISFGLFGEQSKPPIITEGEVIPNIEELIKNINRTSSISAIAFSPDGQTLASVSNTYGIFLWDMTTGQEKVQLGQKYGINVISFSPDGQTLASGSDDNIVRLWDINSCKEKAQFFGHTSKVSSITFSADGQTLASGSYDNTIRLWDIYSGKEKALLLGHEDGVYTINFGPDCQTILSGSFDNTVRLWDIDSGQEKILLQKNVNDGLSVLFSPDGKTFATRSCGGIVHLWDTASGKEKTPPPNLKEFPLSFSPDGHTFALRSFDNTVCLWDIDSNQEKARLQSHRKFITSVAFSPDGKTIASVSSDDTIILWDMASNQEKARLLLYECNIYSFFNPNGQSLASLSYNGTVVLWDLASGQEKVRLRGQTYNVSYICFNSDGKILVSGSHDGKIRLWDVASGREKALLLGHTSRVTALIFSPDGKTLASGTKDGDVRLWDVASGQSKAQLLGHNNQIDTIVFSPDGKILASGGFSNRVILWDSVTYKKMKPLKNLPCCICRLGFSADGKTIGGIICFSNKEYQWDIVSREPLVQFEDYIRYNKHEDTSPNGTLLLNNDGCDCIRIYDNSTDRLIWTFVSGERDNWLSFNSDKRVWRYEDGTLLVEKDEHGLISPIKFPRPSNPGKLALISKPDLITTIDGQATVFPLKFKNTGQSPIYRIRIISTTNKTSPLVFLRPETISVLNPGETITMECRVSAFSCHTDSVESQATLQLATFSDFTSPIHLKIPVQIRGPRLKVIKAEVKNKRKSNLVVSMQNTGSQGIKTVVLINLKINGKHIKTLLKPSIDAHEFFDITFTIPAKIKMDNNALIDLKVNNTQFPFQIWDFVQVPISFRHKSTLLQ